jgi:hypothetical protein
VVTELVKTDFIVAVRAFDSRQQLGNAFLSRRKRAKELGHSIVRDIII